MTDATTITNEIRARSEGSFDSWRIGVTQNIDHAMKIWEEANENLGLWMDWQG